MQMSATGSVGDSFGAGEEDEVEAADEVEACGSPLALHWHAITSHPQSEQRVTKSSWSAKVPGGGDDSFTALAEAANARAMQAEATMERRLIDSARQMPAV